MPHYQHIVQLFVRFLTRDAALLSEIEIFTGDFALAEGAWHFTLPALYKFIQANEHEFNGIDYPAFRQIIFNNPINQSLNEQGGRVFIVENYHNVDKSIYAVGKYSN